MIDEQESSVEETGAETPEDESFYLLGYLCIAIAVLYVGGWSLVWGDHLYTMRALIMDSHRVVFRFNDAYYGLGFHARFFDSPFLSWIAFIVAFGVGPAGSFFIGFFGIGGDD